MDHSILKVAVTITAMVIFSALLPAATADSTALPPYTNHTVGGPTGWFFDRKTNSSATNYSSWAKSQSFYLGDYLIFQTNSNMSVIQTYNKTTYGLCDTSEDGGEDTFVYTDGGKEGFGVAAVVAVPLTAEGESYYFSDADDGIQCLQGMRFQISVGKGRGLPPALSQPPPPPYVDPLTPPPPATTEGSGDPQGEAYYTGGGEKKIGGPRVGIWGFLSAGVFVTVYFLV